MNRSIILYLWLSLSITAFASCNKDETVELPSLSTNDIVKISQDSIQSGGNITSDGGNEVIAKGVCWSTTEHPTIEDSKTQDGVGVGSYNSLISGLSKDTIYYIRAYATNSEGTAYGQELMHNTSLTQEEIFEQMLVWMCGGFSSKNHADTTVNKYIADVRLHMAQIWGDRNSGENIYWLYVEQAYASNLNSPYRQRIYKMILDANGDIYDEIYAIPNATTYLHSYLTPNDFDALSEADLTIKDGCDVAFNWNGAFYEGATTGNSCLSSGIPGVSYIISKSTIRPEWMTSWDLGYSSTGAWVMGPDWPYIFDKVATYNFATNK